MQPNAQLPPVSTPNQVVFSMVSQQNTSPVESTAVLAQKQQKIASRCMEDAMAAFASLTLSAVDPPEIQLPGGLASFALQFNDTGENANEKSVLRHLEVYLNRYQTMGGYDESDPAVCFRDRLWNNPFHIHDGSETYLNSVVEHCYLRRAITKSTPLRLFMLFRGTFAVVKDCI